MGWTRRWAGLTDVTVSCCQTFNPLVTAAIQRGVLLQDRVAMLVGNGHRSCADTGARPGDTGQQQKQRPHGILSVMVDDDLAGIVARAIEEARNKVLDYICQQPRRVDGTD